MRPDRDTFYMSLARLYATRGTCDRAQVGAILVSGNRMVSAGYNGSPPGQDHCDDVGHLMVGNHCIRTVHAEVNCLGQAMMSMQTPTEATLYITHYPCVDCVDMIIKSSSQLGIERVVYGESYNINPITKWRMEEAGIYVEKL